MPATFAAAFEKGGPAWVSRHNLTAAQYSQAVDEFAAQGFRLTSISGYTVNGQDRYAAAFEKGGPAWVGRHNLSDGQYQREVDRLAGEGFRLTCVNAFESAALSTFTFAGDISAENRNRLLGRHAAALASIARCGNLSESEKNSLNEAYSRAIHHTTLNEPGVNASAALGGSTLNVNFGVLFPQGDEEISQTLIHEMMHCAGFSHPARRDPPPGSSCAAPDPSIFDCPNDNGQYYGTAPLRAEFCIAGDQSDVLLRLERRSAGESCVIDQQGVARIREL